MGPVSLPPSFFSTFYSLAILPGSYASYSLCGGRQRIFFLFFFLFPGNVITVSPSTYCEKRPSFSPGRNAFFASFLLSRDCFLFNFEVSLLSRRFTFRPLRKVLSFVRFPLSRGGRRPSPVWSFSPGLKILSPSRLSSYARFSHNLLFFALLISANPFSGLSVHFLANH